MNVIKVKSFLDSYCSALGIDYNLKEVLSELMFTIISKYEKIVPNIPVSMDNSNVYLIKPVEGKYSVEDFFLNRLMRNVWQISEITSDDVKEDFASKSTKGQFDVDFHELSINFIKLENQCDKFKTQLGSNYNQMKTTATKKVIMHEFEHALQTRYTDSLDFRVRNFYKNISDAIQNNSRYSGICNKYEDFSVNYDYSKYLSTGIHCSSYLESLGKKTYRNVKGFDNLNEILNESESLEMSNQKSYLSRSFGDSGNFFPLRNPESSNFDITNYGDMFKIVFGKRNSFAMMYLNPENMFDEFNKKYNDIFRNYYGTDNDAIELFISSITKIKETGSEEEHLKLNRVMSECLKKRVYASMQNLNVTNEQMLESIFQFEKLMIINSDKTKNSNLEHIKVLEKLKNDVFNRDISNIKVDMNYSKIETPSNNYSNNIPGKIIFSADLIKKYDLLESDYQAEKRLENEEKDMLRVKQIIDTQGVNKMLISDLIDTRIVKDKNGNDKIEYTQKQVFALVRLLKACKELDINLGITQNDNNFYRKFIDVPQISYMLKQLYEDRKDENSYIYQMAIDIKKVKEEEKNSNKYR